MAFVEEVWVWMGFVKRYMLYMCCAPGGARSTSMGRRQHLACTSDAAREDN